MELNFTPVTNHTAPATKEWRKTSQYLMPYYLNNEETPGEYNIYPVCSLGSQRIFNGYESLSQWIVEQKTVVTDGFCGILWHEVKNTLQELIQAKGHTLNIVDVSTFLHSEERIEELVKPFLGAPDAVWGTKCTLKLEDLFNLEMLNKQVPDKNSEINIIIGTGAALANWDAALVYIDLPKNELQFRMRAGSITNLGTSQLSEPFAMYKRYYFVDWVLCNDHKKKLLNDIDVIADGQWADTINWMFRSDFVDGLSKISQSVIRVRPWFEPGAWGGQWIKQNIKGLNTDVVNYAWSFELIVPENGIVFESDGYLLEASFDFLMYSNQKEVLGRHAEQFKDEFPIRFDFLDTYDGGNLSIQCHPGLKYIQDNFGETITQDETYYILDCKDNAEVYLGFQESINPEEFKRTLINSQVNSQAIEITKYVQAHQAKKHDLFLIPNGTVHSAGANNMVLEISATPYIFTFKMYDWLRLDLDGNPRPINIEHAFNNLNFERKGNRVQEELISKPSVLERGADWELVHLPTHQQHFYDVHRFDFDTQVQALTQDCCHVMMLVEGESVLLETENGTKQVFAYAETFVIPAASNQYTLTNMGKSKAKVIKAFLK